YLDAGAALSDACFLQSERNFLRSLPCRPLASASFEHSSEAAVRGFWAFSAFAAGAGLAAGAGVCASAEPASRSEAASARPAARKEVVIMEAPMRRGKGMQPRAAMMNRAGMKPAGHRLGGDLYFGGEYGSRFKPRLD